MAEPPQSSLTDSETLFSELRAVRDELARLRTALAPAASVRVWSVQDVVWLGQPIRLLAQVRGTTGEPLVDRTLTLVTSWGEIEGHVGARLARGTALVLRTNELGLARLRLLPTLDEPLSQLQQQSLEVELRRLPLQSVVPNRALPELEALVSNYRADGNFELRQAIDAYFRQFGSQPVDSERREAPAYWPNIPAAVSCFVHDEPDSERGLATREVGVHTVNIRNWLPAWLSVYEAELSADSRLVEGLKVLPRSDRFLSEALVRVQAFVNLEPGGVGNALRHKAAERVLQNFIQAELPQFPVELQVPMMKGVQRASTTLGSGGLTIFSAVQPTRVSALDPRFANVNLEVLAVRLDQSLTTIGKRLDALDLEIVRLRRS